MQRKASKELKKVIHVLLEEVKEVAGLTRLLFAVKAIKSLLFKGNL